MKKIILLFFTVISIQSILSQNTTFGVKGGVNYSSLIRNYDIPPVDDKYKIGFQAGGFARINLVEKTYLQLELLYSLQGSKYDIELLEGQLPQNDPHIEQEIINVKFNESNVILPIMLKYFAFENFNIEFGPQIDYLFSYKIKAKGEESYQENLSDFNFGLNLGVGYDFDDRMGLGLRYNYGFNKADKNFPGKIRNSVFQLSLEYRFN